MREPKVTLEHFRRSGMSLPLFIERRLLCADQIERQGDPPQSRDN